MGSWGLIITAMWRCHKHYIQWQRSSFNWGFDKCTSIGCKARDRIRAPSQYPKRRLFVRSRKVSKPRDWYFKLSYRFEIWQAHRQHCCRSACQISERSDNSKYKSRGFETWRDLTERRLFWYWDGAQGRCSGLCYRRVDVKNGYVGVPHSKVKGKSCFRK